VGTIEDGGFRVRLFFMRDYDEEAAMLAALAEFLNLDATVDEWHGPLFVETLQDFREWFAATDTEEGTVMATMLAFVIQDLTGSRRGAILDEFRSSERVLELFERGVQDLGARGESPAAFDR
jgi:hypothetical protein